MTGPFVFAKVEECEGTELPDGVCPIEGSLVPSEPIAGELVTVVRFEVSKSLIAPWQDHPQSLLKAFAWLLKTYRPTGG